MLRVYGHYKYFTLSVRQNLKSMILTSKVDLRAERVKFIILFIMNNIVFLAPLLRTSHQ